jgi:hypothetical protein
MHARRRSARSTPLPEATARGWRRAASTAPVRKVGGPPRVRVRGWEAFPEEARSPAPLR